MSEYHLRCRVCEEVTRPEPLDACRRCDGPTDVAYDWDRVARDGHRALGRRRPGSRSGATTTCCPPGARVDVGAGWTPLVRARPRCPTLLGIDLHLKLEDANPTHSYKDRVATIAVSAALDHGVTTLCCSSTGNLGDAVAAAAAATGLEAIVLVPVGGASVGTTRDRGAHVFAVRGTYDDCRRLELELGSLFPWGFVERQPASVRERGREDDLVRDRRAARLAAARRRRLPRRERHALREARRRASPR